MDRREQRSRGLALTSAIGRKVARAIEPESAFQEIATREVRDRLKLNGLAFVPLGQSSGFSEYVVADIDQPVLRAGLVRQLTSDQKKLEVRVDERTVPTWLLSELRGFRVVAVALAFGVGSKKEPRPKM